MITLKGLACTLFLVHLLCILVHRWDTNFNLSYLGEK